MQYAHVRLIQYKKLGISSSPMAVASTDSFEDGVLESLASGRVYFLGAESLVEGGATSALRDIEAFLATQNIVISSVNEYYNGAKNTRLIEINSTEYVIQEFPPMLQAGDAETVCSVNFFRIINRLLAQAGSLEKLYLINSFTDNQAGIFLTSDLVDVLNRWDEGSRLTLVDGTLG
jgi:hypothetical protein